MKQTRSLRLIGLLLASIWMIVAGFYAYPDVKEAFDEQSHLAEVAKEHPPMIPTECSRARGVENRDFVREDNTSDRCWVDLASFRRLYPEIASETDEEASALIRGPDGSPIQKGDGSLWREVLQAITLVLGPPLLLLALALVFAPFSARVRTRTDAHWTVGSRASV